jgi:hypothetical protein
MPDRKPPSLDEAKKLRMKNLQERTRMLQVQSTAAKKPTGRGQKKKLPKITNTQNTTKTQPLVRDQETHPIQELSASSSRNELDPYHQMERPKEMIHESAAGAVENANRESALGPHRSRPSGKGKQCTLLAADPVKLDRAIRKFDKASAGETPAVRSAVALYESICRAGIVLPYPISYDKICLFAATLVEAEYKSATETCWRITAFAKRRDLGELTPHEIAQFKLNIAGVARSGLFVPQQAPPMTLAHIEAKTQPFSLSRALCLTCFFFALRPAELKKLTKSNFQRRTTTGANGEIVPFFTMDLTHRRNGFSFRVKRLVHGQVGVRCICQDKHSDAAINANVLELCLCKHWAVLKANFGTKSFSANNGLLRAAVVSATNTTRLQSFRVGSVQHALRDGTSTHYTILRHGRWRSASMVAYYDRCFEFESNCVFKDVTFIKQR